MDGKCSSDIIPDLRSTSITDIVQANCRSLQARRRRDLSLEALHFLITDQLCWFAILKATKCEYQLALGLLLVAQMLINRRVAYSINPWSIKWTHTLRKRMYVST